MIVPTDAPKRPKILLISIWEALAMPEVRTATNRQGIPPSPVEPGARDIQAPT